MTSPNPSDSRVSANQTQLFLLLTQCFGIKANLRDLIAATGLVMSNWIQIVNYCRPCDREIWWMTSKNNWALLLYHVKLCASFQIYWWIQTGFTLQKRSIQVKIGEMLSRVTLIFDRWPWKTTVHLFYATSSFVRYFVAIGEFKLEVESGNAQSGSNSTIFRAVRPWNLMDDFQNNRAPLLCYFKLCASFRTYWWIQTWVTFRKRSIRVKIDDSFWPCDLEILRMTLKNDRASLLWYFKLCASFHTHWWIQIGVTVRKSSIWVKFDDF